MSLDAERHLIGAVLDGYRGIPDLGVAPDDFADQRHGAIWGICLRLFADNSQPDAELVLHALPPELLDRLDGGAAYLHELWHNCPSRLSAPEYAGIVVDAAVRRRLKGAADQIMHLASSPGEVADLHEQARAVVDEAAPRSSRRRLTMLREVLEGVIDRAEKGSVAGMPTPWPDLNNLISGLHPGRLYVVGARPGFGKSIIGANLAVHAHRKGRGSLYLSIEMSRHELGERVLSEDAEVDLKALMDAKLSSDDWSRIAKSYASLSDAPVAVEDAARQTIGTIRAAVRDAKRLMDVAVVVVDYLQLITPTDSRSTREQQVAEASRGLKLIAREQAVPVVALAQLNREATHRRPVMSDFRESGAIEADTDVAMLLHREEGDPESLELIVAKNRHGPIGAANLLLQGYFARVVSSYRGGVPR